MVSQQRKANLGNVSGAGRDEPTVTLKMHDLKMTDKENYGSGKCRTGK